MNQHSLSSAFVARGFFRRCGSAEWSPQAHPPPGWTSSTSELTILHTSIMASNVEDGLLVLPFTPGILADPSPLLLVIFNAAQHARNSLTVLFSTPSGPQLYRTLRQSPKSHFGALQSFLGKVYSALAAGQWAVDNVLLQVEVRFDGELGEWKDKIAQPHAVLVLQGGQSASLLTVGYESLASDIVTQLASSTPHKTIPAPPLPEGEQPESPKEQGYPVSAVGGTFDHLHAAHKLLLHMSLFVTEKRLVVGVVSDTLLASKSHADHLQGLDTRLKAINAFLRRCGSGEITLDVVEIHDALGPTAWDPEITALIVSQETAAGGREVNRVRGEKGLNTLDILSVDVISSTVDGAAGQTLDLRSADDAQLKELKMGSTAIRSWKAKAEKDKEG